MAASYTVTAAAGGETVAGPVALMLTTLFAGSKAKLPGAVIDDADVVQVVAPSSAMKASLYWRPTYSGNSSERNRNAKVAQLALEGTLTSSLRTVTS